MLTSSLEILVSIDQVEEFVSSVLIVFERSKHGAGHRNRVLLLNAAHDHAQMLGFDDDGNALRTDLLVDGFGNLHRQTFLHLKPPRVHVHQAGNLAQTDDAAVGDIRDVAFAEERKQMVLAKAEHLDVFDDNHLIVCDIEQCRVQQLLRIHAVSAGQKTQGVVHSLWSIDQTVAGGVFPDLGENGSNLV